MSFVSACNYFPTRRALVVVAPAEVPVITEPLEVGDLEGCAAACERAIDHMHPELKDCVVLGAHFDFIFGRWNVLVHHRSFPVVLPGAKLPIYKYGATSDNVCTADAEELSPVRVVSVPVE